jgi:multidrug efflux pump
VLRANADGSTVLLKDVARIELGAQTYGTQARLNGKPSTGIGVQLSPSGNALDTAKAVRTAHGRAARYFPPGVKADHPLRQLALRQHLDLARWWRRCSKRWPWCSW